MSTLMQFQSGSDVLIFEAGGTYPASRPIESFQVQDRTAAGTIQVESLGVQTHRRVIVFKEMSLADYTALVDWFLNVVNAGEKTFTFIDERGFSGDVRITDSILDFPETYLDLYEGTLNLEYV